MTTHGIIDGPSAHHLDVRDRVNNLRFELFESGTFAANGYETLSDLIFDLIHYAISLYDGGALLRSYKEWMIDPGYEPDLFFLINLADTLANLPSFDAALDNSI